MTASSDVIDLRPSAEEARSLLYDERAALELEDEAAGPAARPGLRAGLGAEAVRPDKRGTVGAVAPVAGGSLQSVSVATLVHKAKESEPGAWEELVARFGGMIAATGRRYRLTPSDVAELQQTTWLRLVENLHRIEQPERVGGWLATTARRESLQLLKRAAKYHTDESVSEPKRKQFVTG